MSMAAVIESIERDALRQCTGGKLGSLTKSQIDIMNTALESGNSIEIHPAKDGVKIFEIKKRIIK